MKTLRTVAVIVFLAAVAAVLAFRHGRKPREKSIDPRAAIAVECYYGPYDTRTKEVGFPARSLRGPVSELWKWGVQPAKGRALRIGVLFPNREQNDVYWKAVRVGVQSEAARSHVAVELMTSDDYGHVEQHQQQFEALARSGVDAIILGAIHYRAMDTLVERATRGDFGKKIPVIAVVNDVFAPAISGKVLVSFFDMGRMAGHFVCDQARATNNSELSIALFPGPINSGWAPDSLRGFLSVMRDYPGELRVITPQWGSPDPDTQSKLIESVLEANQSIDYIVGNAVAANAAIPILRAAGRESEVRIVSTYYNEALEKQIQGAAIESAPWDQTEALGRIAVGMSVRILNGERPGVDFPFQVGPSILMKTQHSRAITGDPKRAWSPRSLPEAPS